MTLTSQHISGPQNQSTNVLPGNYVSHVLRHERPLPPITWTNWWKELNWIRVAIFSVTPALWAWGACYTKLRWETALFTVLYAHFAAIGVTAGYHRLWSHRSYNASLPLQYFLAIIGTGAFAGSIKWWCRGHRAHHRYTDTELDPYSAHKGLLYSHIGWLVIKPRRKPGAADVSDLARNEVIRMQHRYYVPLAVILGVLVPVAIAWAGWGDLEGGVVYAVMARIVMSHHSIFCVNSLAHYMGEASFDDSHTPRDHFITALLTLGEGYHNFHHQFPMDYRNGVKWYHYDPTKWFIWTCEKMGLASHLKTFPENEIRKCQFTMKMKRLRETQDRLEWPRESSDLPILDWDNFQEQSLTHSLVLISGFIHDISDFFDKHPGGHALLAKYVGKDATAAFFGGVYNHSNAAHNLLAMMRVGVLHGGHPHANDDITIPPSQILRVTRHDELVSASCALMDSSDFHS